jgi:hypothetical protein
MKRHIAYGVFIALAIISLTAILMRSATPVTSFAQSADISQIERYYASLTNCTISVTQLSSMIGSLDGSITIKTNRDISVEWRDHQPFVGDFTNKLYKDGEAGIWQRYQSVNTRYPSLISVLNAANGTSHGVSYIIPTMLLEKESLGWPRFVDLPGLPSK